MKKLLLTLTLLPVFVNAQIITTIAGGGTGATSFTAHGLLVGEGTSPVSSLGAGGAGQVYIQNTNP